MTSTGKILLLIFLMIGQNHQTYIQELPATGLDIEMVFITGKNDVKREVEDFYISSTEITWGLYKLYLNRDIDKEFFNNKKKAVNISVDGISGATVPYVDMSLGMGTKAQLPVGNVTLKAAQGFCRWLSAITGRFYRLPTQAEWYYIDESLHFSEQELSNRAWLSGNSGDRYHEIGSKEIDNFGLYDFYGNVAEWVINPKATEGSHAFLMGGHYKSNPSDVLENSPLQPSNRWKERDPQFPKSKWWFTDAPFVGFRIVSPKKAPPSSDFDLYWGIE